MSEIIQLEKYATLCENDRLKAALVEQDVEVKVHPSCQKTQAMLFENAKLKSKMKKVLKSERRRQETL